MSGSRIYFFPLELIKSFPCSLNPSLPANTTFLLSFHFLGVWYLFDMLGTYLASSAPTKQNRRKMWDCKTFQMMWMARPWHCQWFFSSFSVLWVRCLALLFLFFLCSYLAIFLWLPLSFSSQLWKIRGRSQKWSAQYCKKLSECRMCNIAGVRNTESSTDSVF